MTVSVIISARNAGATLAGIQAGARYRAPINDLLPVFARLNALATHACGGRRARMKAAARLNGDTDGIVQHLMGACGYTYGLTCRPRLSRLDDSLLALPRVEVTGSDGLADFVARMAGGEGPAA